MRLSSVLQESATSVGWQINVDEVMKGIGKEKLLHNTKEALERGSFGVPRYNKNKSTILISSALHIWSTRVQ